MWRIVCGLISFSLSFFENDAIQTLVSVSDACLASACRGYLKAVELDPAWFEVKEARVQLSPIAVLTRDISLSDAISVARVQVSTGTCDTCLTEDEKKGLFNDMIYMRFRLSLFELVVKLYAFCQDARDKKGALVC